jgi:hypothetical protein
MAGRDPGSGGHARHALWSWLTALTIATSPPIMVLRIVLVPSAPAADQVVMSSSSWPGLMLGRVKVSRS